MTDKIKHNRSAVIKSIKRNISLINSIVMLVVVSLLFVNIRFLSSVLNYMPPLSMAVMLGTVCVLVIISLYLARLISQVAISDIEEYDNRINEILGSMQQEITHRVQAEKALEHQAFYDQLTNLPNRVQFTRHLGRISKRPKEHENYLFAVLFVDLDNFKVVNDSMGHRMGDQVLIKTARRLEHCIRTTDMLSRLGGDEFAILLDDITDISDTLRVAERIKLEMSSPFDIDGYEVFITASIGVALNSEEYAQEDDILRDADIAMYQAKSSGRARYEVFDASLRDIAMKRLQLEADLRQGINNLEFMVYYQPIVSVSDCSITGAEALLRWDHPRDGMTLPASFLQVAEDTDLIVKIGELVLATACKQHGAWKNAGCQHIRIDVNFSSRQFLLKNLPEIVSQVLVETGMEPSSLDIEITESIAMEPRSVAVLNELSVMGIRMSIDDFGTGYSSLGYLKRFPIDTIKIDKTFLKEVTVDPNAKAIVIAIIAMAHSLGIKVVAEGVETREQLLFLRSCRCDEAQGYFFGLPMTGEEFVKLLQE
ncbi:MAG: EAL domain-containing protein [Patescibacteria group bacterium]